MALPSLEPIRAVVFDIGGVLFENIQEYFLPDVARRHGLDPEHMLSLGYRHGAEWGLGRSTEEDYWRGILTDAGLDLALMPSLIAETDAYIRPIAPTWQIVRELPAHLMVGLLSNTTWEWVRRQRAAWERELTFEPALLSCELGLCKPDPAIYGLLLERVALPGAQVLFVDDRADNLAAAAASGIQGHRFQDAAGLRDELTRRGIELTSSGAGDLPAAQDESRATGSRRPSPSGPQRTR